MTHTHQRPAEDIAVVGVDIGKDVFHLIGFDGRGKIVFRRKIKRLALIDTFKALPPCVVGMEACLSAHFVARTLRKLGHEPRIIPAKYSKPFVKGQKNDYNDAEAIAEAALRPNLRTVREKTQKELDLQAYHRIRSRLVSRRTATINQIRAFLIEQGITVRSGAHALRTSLFQILQNRADEISPRMTDLIVELYEDWLWLDERIETITSEIEKIAAGGGKLSAVDERAGRRSDHFNGHGGGGRRWRSLRAWSRFRRLAWAGSQTIQHGRQADIGKDIEAREPLSANAVHPGGQCHPHAPAQLDEVQLRPMADRRGDPIAPQQTRYSIG